MLARVRFDPFEIDAVIRLERQLNAANVHLILDPKHI